MPVHKGSSHCGAIGIELQTPRTPEQQVIGACQCTFCRKHNVRAFSDPKSSVILTVYEPGQLQLYEFGLCTSQSVVCSRCGVYLAMVLFENDQAWSTISIDALDERELFIQVPNRRDYSRENAEERTTRRKNQWMPTKLIGWPKQSNG